MANNLVAETNDSYTPIKIFIIFAAILIAMLEIVDITSVNVAIPSLMGKYNVSVHTADWVISAYVIASAIVTPLTGRLALIFGQKQLLIICMLGFALSSILCGCSTNISEMIIFRIFQGGFGACLVPLSEFILLNNFKKSQYRFVLGIWGMGILLASVAGPLIGGLIMAYLHWRWIFFINIPIVILAIIIIWFCIAESERVFQSLDYLGLITLCIAIGSFEYIINEGESFGWLESKFITYLMIVFVASTLYFLVRTIRKKAEGILDLRIFKDRKFSLSVISVIVFSIIFMGISGIIPVFEQQLLHFTPLMNGITSLPAGIASVVGIIAAMLLVKYIDNRYLILAGILILFYGNYVLGLADLNVSMRWLSVTLAIRAFGFGLFFFPITLISILNLPREYLGIATALFNFSRNIGVSLGVNISSSSLNTLIQHNWEHMRQSITLYQPGLTIWLAKQKMIPNLSATDPVAIGLFNSYVAKTSFLQAFSSITEWSGLLLLILIPITYFIGKVKIKEPLMPPG